MNIILICCIVFLLIVCILLSVKLYNFSILILSIEIEIEESLDVLNENYGKINEILNKPIFFDSVEIRQVILSIEESHTSLLMIANKLTNNLNIGLESETKEENIKEVNN